MPRLAGSYMREQRKNENIYIGVIILFFAVLSIVGFRMLDAEARIREIEDRCEIFEDGSAICQNDTFEWEGN